MFLYIFINSASSESSSSSSFYSISYSLCFISSYKVSRKSIMSLSRNFAALNFRIFNWQITFLFPYFTIFFIKSVKNFFKLSVMLFSLCIVLQMCCKSAYLRILRSNIIWNFLLWWVF